MRLVSIAALLACGCLTPRSIMLGQTAAAVGRGAAEVGLGTGVGYATQSAPPMQGTQPNGNPQTTQQASHGLAVPAFEGNATVGLSDVLGINAHVSPAGIQPGLKITIADGRLASFALLPEFGIGYASYGQSTYVTGTNGVPTETVPTSTTSFTFMAGLRVLLSLKAGFYAGVGYDFIATRSVSSGTMGTGNMSTPFQELTQTQQHQITVNLGWSVKVGWIRIRPELAIGIIPALSQTFTAADGTSTSTGGGNAFIILPGFSLVAVTPRPTHDAAAEEDERNVNPDGDDKPPPENDN